MNTHGFFRVAAASPRLLVGDCRHNADQILTMLSECAAQGVQLVVFPELCLTGYTCGDLFQQPTLQTAAAGALDWLIENSQEAFRGLVVVGLPVLVGDQLFNCAAIFQAGILLGLVPKSYLPNYQEFYEARWFTPGLRVQAEVAHVAGRKTAFGTNLLFDGSKLWPRLVVGVEVCEDLWVPIPPSSHQALAGANLLLNLSASNEVIGKAAYRRKLVESQSGRCLAGYVYASCGVHESTTDVVFGGHCLIAENGVLLQESERFARAHNLIVADIDLQRLGHERQKTNTFAADQEFGTTTWRRIPFNLAPPEPAGPLRGGVEAHPFVPRGQEQLHLRCQDIFQTQVAGLAKRLEHIGHPAIALGVSGGLDSTLALLVACKTLDLLQWPRTRLQAITMPGFGTSLRTLTNARTLMRQLGVTGKEIDIRPLCLEEMRALGHQPFRIDLKGLDVGRLTALLAELPAERRNDLVFENVQARMRTSLLMNTGFVIGTGDLSEAALGWSTFNGDQMSMYNPNASIPKTLVKFLVRWAAENEFAGLARVTLLDIVATLISPELLPPEREGHISQATESLVGPYELHDFFLFHFLRYGAPPEKILYLASQARFEGTYSSEEIRRWLKVFLQRFFANQFKRSCLPDGPKVGSISLSPRGDWRMPSDAQATAWLAWAEEEVKR